ncbi:MAG: hypothetical protein LBQ40_06450 [Clostridiales bacterium]|nr:hypothetical protein [Clostridiales bacterium]
MILNLEEMNLITTEAKATALSNDVVIGKYLFNTWNYDTNAKELSASFRDAIDKWHNIVVLEQPLQENVTALDLYNLLKTFDDNILYEDLSNDMQAYLTSIKIRFMYLEESNLWAEWNKLADEAKVLVFLNNYGEVTLRLS